jgi:Xaa-Pro dipeptidase
MTDLLTGLRHASRRAELTFPAAEYEARTVAATAAMARRGFDLVLFNHLPSICYLTGYQTPATSDHNCLFVAASGKMALQLIEHEVPNAILASCVDDVRSFSWYLPDTIPRQMVEIIGDLVDTTRPLVIGIEKERQGLTVGLLEALQRALPSARLEDASALLNDQRRIKSAAELEYLRQSGRLSVIGADAALRALRPGCSDNEIAAAAYEAMIRNGSEYASTQPFIATGPRSGMVHTTFKRRKILDGEAVFVETASSYQRYTAPVMRSAFMGKPTVQIERLRAGVRDTLELLLENLRPGMSAHEVAVAASRGFRAVRGEIYFQGAYGYHVGLSLPPAWWEGLTPFIAEGIEEELAPGMVFHLPIAARIPGVCGVALSETVAISASGCESLTATERSFRDVSY